MGQEFVKAPANMNPWIGEMVLTAAAKVFSSSTQVGTGIMLNEFGIAHCWQVTSVSFAAAPPYLMSHLT